MAELGDDGTDIARALGHVPEWLERPVASCLAAEADDSRLGDLAEQYVRMRQRLSADLGTAPWATVVSRLAADVRYLAAGANVVLFARAIDPGQRLVEDGAAALVALELRERTMSMLQVAVRRLALPALLLLCSALLINSAIDTWRSWRQTEALMASIQREKAEFTAQKIESFMREIERQIGWVAYAQFGSLPADQRHFDYVRLLRQVPAITELAQLDRAGREQLRVSRLKMDAGGSNVDRSSDPAFIEAKANKVYFGPVAFRKGSEPYLTVGVSHGDGGSVTIVDLNLKLVWDIIKTVSVGETGYGYVVDSKGRLVSHPDIALVLRGPDLSALPQVVAALAGPPSGELVDGANLRKQPVRSVHAEIPALGWRVFVDLPTAETDAAFWSAVIRASILLALGLIAAFLGVRIAVRPFTSPPRAASA
jgi:hypothetical protein